MIPTRKFVVFYNGEEKQPEIQELRLSDAFEKPTDDPKLELKCMVYNINTGKNKKLMEQCRWLDEYMIFVNKVREYHHGNTEQELLSDIEKAIDYCIDNDILRDFLKTRRSEVVKNMQLDYTFERQIELERADAIEEGREQGREEGREQGREEGRTHEVYQSVADGDYSIQRGAQKLSMTVDELKQEVIKAGYRIMEVPVQ